MATDMWTMINRELAKIEGLRGGASNTPYLDVVSETMKYAKEDRAWRERKNLQRQQVMSELSRGTSMTFNEKDLARKKERFQNYYNKYKGTMDEATLEMGQFMLDDFDMQGEKNLDFTKQENKLESMQTNMVNALKEFDRMDASQNENYANKVKDLNEEWLDYVSDFKKTHGTRLSLKPFQHIDSQLDNGAKMNDFLLGAIRDDNYIDDAEYQAWKDSWESLSLEPISIYKQKEVASNTFVLQSASKQLVENIEEYQALDSFIKGRITMKIDDMETSWADLDAPRQAAYWRQIKQSEKEIKNLDKNYSNKLGKSFVDEMYPDGLFPSTTTPLPKDKDELPMPIEEIKELKPGEEFKVPQEDISRLEKGFKEYAEMNFRGKLKGDKEPSFKQHDKVIFKEFEKAKKNDASLTIDDFISHRADIYSDWKDDDDTYKETMEKAKTKALSSGRLNEKELKLWRKDVGSLKDNKLKKFFWHQGTFWGSSKQDSATSIRKLNGITYKFNLVRSDSGRLKVSKRSKNRYTGKWEKATTSSIDEFNQSKE